MRIAQILTLLCPIGTGACFPLITHGARVENGAAIGLTASTTSGETHVEGDEGGIHLRDGIIGAYAGYGWAATPRTAPGFYLGIAVPVLFPAAQVDAYLQAPPAWTGPLQAGVGAVAAYDEVHGYGMLGRQDDAGKGWSVHAGYGVRGAASSFLGRSPAFIAGGAVHLPFARHGRVQGYVDAAQGRDPESCFSDPPGSTTRRCTPGRSTHAIAFGIALGWHK